MLLAAKRPVILVGQGVRYGGAAAELLALAEKLQIPVAASASGLGALPSDHPLSLGLVSRGGVYQANHAARQADVLLALGVRFDDRTSIVMDSRLLLHDPADQAHPRRHRPGGDRAQLSGRARADGGRAHLPAPGAGRARRAARPSMRRRQHARNGSAPSTATARNGTRWWRPASRTTRRRSIRSARPIEIDRVLPEDAHPGQRHRRAPQLAACSSASRSARTR